MPDDRGQRDPENGRLLMQQHRADPAGQPAFSDVAQQREDSGLFPAHAQDIGKSHIPTAGGAWIHSTQEA